MRRKGKESRVAGRKVEYSPQTWPFTARVPVERALYI